MILEVLAPSGFTNVSNLLSRTVAALVLAVAIGPPLYAGAPNAVYKVPPVKIPLDVKGQPISITASAVITISSSQNLKTLDLEFKGDLSDLQQNLTGLLSSEMDKDDRCGERLTIQNATLVPVDPASLATISLHYERWGCVKVFGKQEAKKLIGGDAQIQIKLTPSIDENNTELRLVPEVGRIQADGSLGELLRSGVLGETIRNKVQSSITSALQKGANLSATLPPAVQNYVSIQNAEFKDGGSGNLLVVLDGRVSLTQEQVQYLTNQLKERIASR
jgi:hypothetical protein